MKDYPYLYRGSLAEARRRNQIDLWQESLRENIRCKDAIEEAIRRDFDGMHLKGDCVRRIIEQYGFKRTAWVLSNTLQQKEWDGRFSPQNKEWAKKDIHSRRRTLYRVFGGESPCGSEWFCFAVPGETAGAEADWPGAL